MTPPPQAGVTPPVRVAGFASGGGTNLQALLDHETADGPYHIVVVISDREGAGRHGIDITVE